MFVALNGHRRRADTDDAVDDTMLAIAAGDLDEAAVSAWIAARIDQPLD